jgi:hypothetical protein
VTFYWADDASVFLLFCFVVTLLTRAGVRVFCVENIPNNSRPLHVTRARMFVVMDQRYVTEGESSFLI